MLSSIDVNRALDGISAQKSNRISADDFYTLASGRAHAHDTETNELELAKVYRAYENQLKTMTLLVHLQDKLY